MSEKKFEENWRLKCILDIVILGLAIAGEHYWRPQKNDKKKNNDVLHLILETINMQIHKNIATNLHHGFRFISNEDLTFILGPDITKVIT